MPKGKNRQLALEDGIFIEDRIKARDSLSEAARRLGVSASTVPREVKRNRAPESPGYRVARENLCRKAAECTVAGLCGTGCLAPCRKCGKGPSTCNALCPDFAPRPCPSSTARRSAATCVLSSRIEQEGGPLLSEHQHTAPCRASTAPRTASPRPSCPGRSGRTHHCV